MTIQALHSDVILHVPDGVYGIILGNIHTDHWRFRHLVGENDCIISPICDFNFKGSTLPEGSRFRIQVSHIVGDSGPQKQIKVKHGLTNEFSAAKYITNCDRNSEDVYFNCNSSKVDIYTRHFSKYIIYAENLNCCGKRVAMLGFSKMPKSGRMATVILYFCSRHYMFEGYKEVCDFHIYIQYLLPPTNKVWDKVMFSQVVVSHSVNCWGEAVGLCMMSLPVWLPGSMFLLGVSMLGPLCLCEEGCRSLSGGCRSLLDPARHRSTPPQLDRSSPSPRQRCTPLKWALRILLECIFIFIC